MAVIGINYADEGKKTAKKTYKSVYLHYGATNQKAGRGKEKKFRSKDFIKDWYRAVRFFIVEGVGSQGEIYLSYSSSVDHFFFDGADYQSAYLMYEDEPYVDENGKSQSRKVGVLRYYDDEKDLLLQEKMLGEGIEWFVPKNARWTWQELKDYVKKGIKPKRARKNLVK